MEFTRGKGWGRGSLFYDRRPFIQYNHVSRVRYSLLVEEGRIESIFCSRNCTLNSIKERAGRESAVLLNFRGERELKCRTGLTAGITFAIY